MTDLLASCQIGLAPLFIDTECSAIIAPFIAFAQDPINAALTNEGVAPFCGSESCYQKFITAMRTFSTCMAGSEDSADIAAMVSQYEDSTCVKDVVSDVYCGSWTAEFLGFSLIPAEFQCAVAQSMGCCYMSMGGAALTDCDLKSSCGAANYFISSICVSGLDMVALLGGDEMALLGLTGAASASIATALGVSTTAITIYEPGAPTGSCSGLEVKFAYDGSDAATVKDTLQDKMDVADWSAVTGLLLSMGQNVTVDASGSGAAATEVSVVDAPAPPAPPTPASEIRGNGASTATVGFGFMAALALF